MEQRPQAVGKATRRDLEILKRARILRGFYLGGGTGLAFLFAHRQSRDLDFFTPRHFDERLLVERLRREGSFTLEKREPGTVRGRFRRTLVSFFHYPYPLLRISLVASGVRVASPIDIACMKLDAVSSRGAKRDFIDLYTIIRKTHTPLPRLLRAFARKYASLRYNLMHVKKSLVYFADAEKDPMPKLLVPLNWKVVKAFFISEARKL